jgi:enoyl-CoA hydratase/carnithine racemase
LCLIHGIKLPFCSNGLDIDNVMRDAEFRKKVLDSVNEIFLRLYSLSCATVAVVSGHAFALGMMIVLCHDYRIMRADKVGKTTLLNMYLTWNFSWFQTNFPCQRTNTIYDSQSVSNTT